MYHSRTACIVVVICWSLLAFLVYLLNSEMCLMCCVQCSCSPHELLHCMLLDEYVHYCDNQWLLSRGWCARTSLVRTNHSCLHFLLCSTDGCLRKINRWHLGGKFKQTTALFFVIFQFLKILYFLQTKNNITISVNVPSMSTLFYKSWYICMLEALFIYDV